MLKKIRTSWWGRATAAYLALSLLAEIIAPAAAYALTGGPSQPEVQSFEPVATSEMVDPFTGDFNYNIPLLDVGGYPINLSYHSGQTMDQEASWVGLGWNINPGAVVRNKRGMPDDFDGDIITKKMNMKPNRTWGLNAGIGAEVYGFDNLSIGYGLGISYNNYNGIGFEQSLDISITSGKGGKGPLTGGLGITSGADGLSLSPSVSFSHKVAKAEGGDLKLGGSIGLNFNSRAGLKSLTLNANAKLDDAVATDKNGKVTGTYDADLDSRTARWSFGLPTYSPQMNMEMLNTSVNLSFKMGVHIFGGDGTFDVGGYYSEQRLKDKMLQLPAYGYMNSEKAMPYNNALLDFNREKDGSFSQNTPALPVTNHTYDVYSVSGQGIGGSYRPFRSDMGYVYDNESGTFSDSYALGVEISGTQALHGGVDISFTGVSTESGRWTQDNAAEQRLQFRGSTGNAAYNPLYEPYYLKDAGEKSVDSDPTFFSNTGGFDPVQVGLEDAGGMLVRGKDFFVRKTSPQSTTTQTIPTNNYRAARQKRNQPITQLTKAEAKEFGLQKSIYITGTGAHPTMPVNAAAKDHHIAEISALRADGSRYVYGLPAYNTLEKEVSFNASGNSFSCNDGLVSYTPGDNSENNTLGIDNYFTSSETPAYAHSYMLTAVLSPDFVDMTGNGPSQDDLGSWTQLNYKRLESAGQSTYHWRVPVEANEANHSEGLKSDPDDERGSYVYGTKEIWYVTSIENKNYVAIFHTSPRADGYGASGENGGLGALPMHKLDKISLYARPEYYLSGGGVNPNAVPIKEVHFVYDYSLCKNVPNNNGTPILVNSVDINANKGKLTLKQVYFTYGASQKARMSSYKFEYADRDFNGSDEVNYSYNMKGYDRWGNYKPNPNNPTCSPTGALMNAEFPYVDQAQTQAMADEHASAWELTKITLPSGGEIRVNYEADDYAWVQDNQAMQMVKMKCVGEDRNDYNPATTSMLIDPHTFLTDDDPRDYLFFQLPVGISSSLTNSAADQEFYKKYLTGYVEGSADRKRIGHLYFRFLVDMTNAGKYEYVSGYAQIDWNETDPYGVVAPSSYGGSGDYVIGFVRLKQIGANDDGLPKVNPISKAAWQFGRLNTPRTVWDQPNVNDAPIDQFITALGNANFIDNIIQMFEGPNIALRNKDYGKTIVNNKSWLRLYVPEGKKYGGGSRVKKLEIDDNWQGMSTSQQHDATYGQTYEYTVYDPDLRMDISSGVAAYEPTIGNDENPFRQPVPFGNIEEKVLAPDDEHYMEEPFGESFFPSPVVGYSRVKVRNLTDPLPAGTELQRHGTGHVVHEFYTAKDFPTITDRTQLTMLPKKTDPILGLLKISALDYMTASQGFVIELNDMHGKPKAQTVYAEGQTSPISYIRYHYKTDPNNSKRLSNDCPVINKDGSISTAQIGVDHDFVADFRQQRSFVLNAGLNLNLACFVVGILPALVPSLFPSFSMEETQFRSAGVTKVINRYGILERTEAMDLSSVVSTENLAYDSETGNVLLTKTKNDFEDNLYSFSYPAHWAYDRMGHAYRNLAAKFSNVTFSSGWAVIANGEGKFAKGDEVAIVTTGTATRGWVCNVSEGGGNATITVLTSNGSLLPNTSGATLKILRSGRRNQQLTPVGAVTSLVNPIDNNNDGTYETQITFADVLNTQATEFSEEWGMFCGTVPDRRDVCLCTATPQVDALKTFLHSLALAGKLVSPTNTTIFNSGAYSYGYSSVLHSGLTPQDPQAYWLTAVAGQNLNGKVIYNSSPSGFCTVNLTLPSGYSWSDVTGVLSLTPGDAGADCSPTTNTISAMLTVNQGGTTVGVKANGSCCWTTTVNCGEISLDVSGCGVFQGMPANPYVQGLRGQWRPKRSYLYLAERRQDILSGNTSIRTDGAIVTRDASNTIIPFQPFWNPNGALPWTKDATYWTFTSEVSQYSPFGAELENRDALGRYSSAVYGYNHSLPVAVASNSRYRDIAFDGFEDYDFVPAGQCNTHFDFLQYLTDRSSTEHHTGKYSLKVEPDEAAVTTRPLTSEACVPGTPGCPFDVSCRDCIGTFSPVTYEGAKRFVLSYWVKLAVPAAQQPVFDYPTADVSVSISGGPLTLANVRRSDIIEGWQRVEAEFTIPGGSTGFITVQLNNNSIHNAFFDDIRIQPFNSSMKAYVYHTKNLRYTAALDENNYATFYEYDEDGTLIRVKKETERGIMTIQESRTASRKQ